MWTLLVAWVCAAERIEIPMDKTDDMNLVRVESAGVLVYIQRAGERKSYEIRAYDGDLNPTWTETTPARAKQLEWDSDADSLSAWMVASAGTKAFVLRTVVADGKTEQVDLPVKGLIVSQRVVADGVGGAWTVMTSTKGDQLTYVGPDALSVAVPIGKKRLVMSLERGTAGEVLASLRGLRQRRGEPLDLLSLKQGAIARSVSLTADEDIVLQAGRVAPTESQTLVIGTWGRTATLAEGVFTSVLDPNGVPSAPRTVRFAELKNFYDWKSDGAEERLEAKAEKKQDKGKETKDRVLLAVHSAVVTPEGTAIVAAEALRANYRYVTTTEVVNGVTHTVTTRVFIGWSVPNAYLFGIAADGTISWDQSIKLGIPPAMKITPHLRLVPEQGGSVAAIFALGRKLHRVSLKDGEFTGPVEGVSAADVHADPEVFKRSVWADSGWWYDERFLAFGVDKVKDSEEGRVFWAAPIDSSSEH